MVCLRTLLAPPQDGEADLAGRHGQPMETSQEEESLLELSCGISPPLPTLCSCHHPALRDKPNRLLCVGKSPSIWHYNCSTFLAFWIGHLHKATNLYIYSWKTFKISHFDSHRNHIFIMSYVLKYCKHKEEVSIPLNILVRYFVVSRSTKFPLPLCHMPMFVTFILFILLYWKFITIIKSVSEFPLIVT